MSSLDAIKPGNPDYVFDLMHGGLLPCQSMVALLREALAPTHEIEISNHDLCHSLGLLEDRLQDLAGKLEKLAGAAITWPDRKKCDDKEVQL